MSKRWRRSWRSARAVQGWQSSIVVGWSLFGYGALTVTAAALNARGRPWLGLAAMALRVGPIYATGAMVGAQRYGFQGVIFAAIVANAFGVVATFAIALIGGQADQRRPNKRLDQAHAAMKAPP